MISPPTSQNSIYKTNNGVGASNKGLGLMVNCFGIKIKKLLISRLMV